MFHLLALPAIAVAIAAYVYGQGYGGGGGGGGYGSAVCARTNGERLANDLLKTGYDKQIAPYVDYVNPIDVTITLNIVNAFLARPGIDNAVSITGSLGMNWKDARLAWDPKNYGGLTEVNLNYKNIWQPDIKGIIDVFESGTDEFISYKDLYFATVSSDGSVGLSVRVAYTTVCTTDGASSLYGSSGSTGSYGSSGSTGGQRYVCPFAFEPWSYGSSKIMLYDNKQPLVEIPFRASEFNLISSKTDQALFKYSNGATFSQVTYTITFERKTNTASYAASYGSPAMAPAMASAYNRPATPAYGGPAPAPAMAYGNPAPAMAYGSATPAPTMAYGSPAPAMAYSAPALAPAMAYNRPASPPAPAMAYGGSQYRAIEDNASDAASQEVKAETHSEAQAEKEKAE